MIKVVDPARVFVNSRGGALEVTRTQSQYKAVAIGGDVTIITAVAGKRHRVMGWHLSAGLAGNTSFLFYNGASAGGLILLGVNAIAGSRDFAPITESGYFECSTNTALVVVGGTTNGLVNIFYTTYTP